MVCFSELVMSGKLYYNDEISWNKLGRRVCRSIVTNASGLGLGTCVGNAMIGAANASGLGPFGTAIAIAFSTMAAFHGNITGSVIHTNNKRIYCVLCKKMQYIFCVLT